MTRAIHENSAGLRLPQNRDAAENSWTVLVLRLDTVGTGRIRDSMKFTVSGSVRKNERAKRHNQGQHHFMGKATGRRHETRRCSSSVVGTNDNDRVQDLPEGGETPGKGHTNCGVTNFATCVHSHESLVFLTENQSFTRFCVKKASHFWVKNLSVSDKRQLDSWGLSMSQSLLHQ